MAFWWRFIGGLQYIVVVRSFLRMLRLRELAVCKLYLSRGGPSRCHVVLEHGLNLHRNIPLSTLLFMTKYNLENNVQTFL